MLLSIKNPVARIVLINEGSKLTRSLGATIQYDSDRRNFMSRQFNSQTISDTANEIAKDTSEKADSQDENTEGMSLLERMKARRRRELGQ